MFSGYIFKYLSILYTHKLHCRVMQQSSQSHSLVFVELTKKKKFEVKEVLVGFKENGMKGRKKTFKLFKSHADT